MTIKFTPSFDLTLGGRYSNNDQDVRAECGWALFGVADAHHDHHDSSEDVFTYSIAPKFKFNDRMAIYARVAKGFRPGGPERDRAGSPRAFPPPTSPTRPSTTNWA